RTMRQTWKSPPGGALESDDMVTNSGHRRRGTCKRFVLAVLVLLPCGHRVLGYGDEGGVADYFRFVDRGRSPSPSHGTRWARKNSYGVEPTGTENGTVPAGAALV